MTDNVFRPINSYGDTCDGIEIARVGLQVSPMRDTDAIRQSRLKNIMCLLAQESSNTLNVFSFGSRLRKIFFFSPRIVCARASETKVRQGIETGSLLSSYRYIARQSSEPSIGSQLSRFQCARFRYPFYVPGSVLDDTHSRRHPYTRLSNVARRMMPDRSRRNSIIARGGYRFDDAGRTVARNAKLL